MTRGPVVAAGGKAPVPSRRGGLAIVALGGVDLGTRGSGRSALAVAAVGGSVLRSDGRGGFNCGHSECARRKGGLRGRVGDKWKTPTGVAAVGREVSVTFAAGRPASAACHNEALGRGSALRSDEARGRLRPRRGRDPDAFAGRGRPSRGG